jgi:hypothetical protein
MRLPLFTVPIATHALGLASDGRLNPRTPFADAGASRFSRQTQPL